MGRGRVFDNIFVECLWRTVKLEEVCLHEYEAVAEARAGLGWYFEFYTTLSVCTSRWATGLLWRCTVLLLALRLLSGLPPSWQPCTRWRIHLKSFWFWSRLWGEVRVLTAFSWQYDPCPNRHWEYKEYHLGEFCHLLDAVQSELSIPGEGL